MCKKLVSIFLIFCVLTTVLPAFAAEEAAHYTAIAASQLKMRKTPFKDAFGNGQIREGDTVHIIEYDAEWAKVIRGKTVGYVLVRYLDNIQPVPGDETVSKQYSSSEPDTEENGNSLDSQETIGQMQNHNAYHQNFSMTPSNFQAKFKASTIGSHEIMRTPEEEAKILAYLKIYTELDVGEVVGDWCFVRYGNVYGYIKTKNLFKWDRYDAYAGPIPNLDVWTQLIWINKEVRVRELGTNKVLDCVNADTGDVLMPGAAIAAWDKDDEGRYIFPVERTYGYVYEEDVAYAMPVKDWETAESGDLISVMTTFFSVGVHTLEFQGRNWNIRLAGTMINGTVLQPGETYNQNDVIGPYSKPTGYKVAPTTTKAGYGGGTCQINSTFYVTSIQVPILITQRQVHQNVGMHYIKIGLDASVGGGNNTLRLMNTLPYAIRYQFFISDGVLTCAIFRD